jgi:hypothetical protein
MNMIKYVLEKIRLRYKNYCFKKIIGGYYYEYEV